MMIPTILFSGKMAIFGGPNDSGMKLTEGLSLYEHHEADKRSDLFNPRSSDLSIGTSKRLKENALYFACRFPLKIIPRSALQRTRWIFHNPANGKKASLWLVDYGPNLRTGRMFDVSVYAADRLGLKTDDVVEVFPFS